MDTATIIGLLITVIGTIASLIGAGISIKQSNDAADSANSAKKIRNQLVNLRRTSEMSELKALSDRAIKDFAKYGPSSTNLRMHGANIQSDALCVQEFLTKVKEHAAEFEKGEGEIFTEKTTKMLEMFVDPNERDNLKRNGTNIYWELAGFSAKIKQLLDFRKEDAE